MFRILSFSLLLFGAILLSPASPVLAQDNKSRAEREEKFIGELITRLGMTDLAEDQIKAYEESFPDRGKQVMKMKAMIQRRKAASEADFEKKVEALAGVVGVMKQILADLPDESPDRASIATEIAQSAGAYAIVVGDNVNRAELKLTDEKKKKYMGKATGFLTEALKFYDDAVKPVKEELDKLAEERDAEAPPSRREQNLMTKLMDMDLNRSDLIVRLSNLYLPTEEKYLDKLKEVDKRMGEVRDNHSEDLLGVYLAGSAYSIKKKIYLYYTKDTKEKKDEKKAEDALDEMNELISSALEQMLDAKKMEERQVANDKKREKLDSKTDKAAIEKLDNEDKIPIYLEPQKIAALSPVLHMTYLRFMTEKSQLHLALKDREKELDKAKAIFTEVSKFLPDWEKLDGPTAEIAKELLFEKANWLKASGRAADADVIWARLADLGGRVGENSKDKLRGGESFAAKEMKAGELFKSKKYEEAGTTLTEMLKSLPQSIPNRMEKELEIIRLMIISYDEVARAAKDTASCDKVIELCKNNIKKLEGESYAKVAKDDLKILSTILRNATMLKKKRKDDSVPPEELSAVLIIYSKYHPEEDNTYNLGALSYQQGKLKDAIKNFEMVAKESDKYADAQIMIARCYFDQAQDAKKNNKEKDSKDLMDKRLNVLKKYLADMKARTKEDQEKNKTNVEKIEFEVDMTNAQTLIVDSKFSEALQDYEKLSKKYPARERDMNEQILRLYATCVRVDIDDKKYESAITNLQKLEEYMNKIIAVDVAWKEKMKYIDYLAQMWRKTGEANDKGKLGLKVKFNNTVADWYYKSYEVHKEVDPPSVNADFIKKIIYYISKSDKDNPNFAKYTAATYDLYKAQLKAMKFEGLPHAGDEDVVSKDEMEAITSIEVEVFSREERNIPDSAKLQDKFKLEYLRLVDNFFPEKKEGDKTGAALGINYDGVLKSHKKMKSMFPNHKIFKNESLIKLMNAAEERNNAIKLITNKLLPRAKELKNDADRESWLMLLYDYYHDEQAVLDMANFFEETGNFKRAKDFYVEMYSMCTPGDAKYVKYFYKYVESAWKADDKGEATKQAAYFKSANYKNQLTPDQQKMIDKILGGK